jgi:hypothetical protein
MISYDFDFWCFNATFSNISAISWRPVFVVEEAGENHRQGRIQDFKLGGGAVKKIVPSRGRREHFWGISCEKSRFYAKKSYFFQF